MHLPLFHYFFYVLGTVNLVMAGVFLLAALVFSGGINAVSLAVVALMVNLVSAATVVRRL